MVGWIWQKLGYSDILVLGSAFVDTVVDTKFPIFDDERPGAKFERAAGVIRQTVGGSGYNIAVNLASPPSRRRRDRQSVGLFTYLPAGLELSELIIRKLKVARVGTSHVRRLKVVGQYIPTMGGFVGMREERSNGMPGRVVVGRFDSVFSRSGLFDEPEQDALQAAIRKTSALVVDAPTDLPTISMVLDMGFTRSIPVFVNAASYDSFIWYLKAMASVDAKDKSTLVAVRAHTLRRWAEGDPDKTGVIERLRLYGHSGASMEIEKSETAGRLCKWLHADNVLVTTAPKSDESRHADAFEFAVFDWNDNILRISVSPEGQIVNSHGARDAAFSAMVSILAPGRARARPSAASGESVIDADRRITQTVNDYVKHVMHGPGATRNAPIDETQTEHPIREFYYRTRATVGQWVLALVVGSALPTALHFLKPYAEDAWRQFFDMMFSR